MRSTYITKDQAPEEINNLILLLKFDTILSICFGHTDQTVVEIQVNINLLKLLYNTDGYLIRIMQDKTPTI